MRAICNILHNANSLVGIGRNISAILNKYFKIIFTFASD